MSIGDYDELKDTLIRCAKLELRKKHSAMVDRQHMNIQSSIDDEDDEDDDDEDDDEDEEDDDPAVDGEDDEEGERGRLPS